MGQRFRRSKRAAAIRAVEATKKRPRPLAHGFLPAGRPTVSAPMPLERRDAAEWGVAVRTFNVMVEVCANMCEGVEDAYGGRLPAPAPVQRAHPRARGLASGELDEVRLSQVMGVRRGPREVRGDVEHLRASGPSREKEATLEMHVL
jgi:hypothetical protein